MNKKPGKKVTVVIFGSTGNLTQIKLLPALESLVEDRVVGEGLRIVAVGRGESTDAEYYDSVASELRTGLLRERVAYFRGDAGSRGGLRGLGEFLREKGLDRTDLIFYFATPPGIYESIARELAAGGLMQEAPGGPFRRAVIEKPLGNDLVSAGMMIDSIYGLIDESQVFLIDHYLGKEAIQNLIFLRFLNDTYDASLRSEYVQDIQITISEEGGIGDRGRYYDGVGAVRDMLQSHILQIIAFLTMERPQENRPDAILKNKLQAIKNIRFSLPLRGNLVLGQYEGYLKQKHVAPGSDTPTYVALRLHVAQGPLEGVPIFVRTGKALAKKHARIVIQFKPRRSPFSGEILPGNKIVVTIQPDAWIMFFFKHKVPGLTMGIKEVGHFFFREESFVECPREGYQRLFYEIIQNNRLLFTTPDEVMASWIFADRLLATAAAEGITPVVYPWGLPDLPESGAMLARHGFSWFDFWFNKSGEKVEEKSICRWSDGTGTNPGC